MNKNKTLICFTSSYPYGNRETYFVNELEYLSNNFKKIIIIPTYNPYSVTKRETPHNVEVLEPVLKQGVKRIIDFFVYFKINKVLLSEFFKHKVFKNKVTFNNWFISFITYGKGYKKFKSYNLNPKEVILYSYWAGKDFFIEKDLIPFTKVVRMHGGDFYIDRNNGYLPLRKNIYDSANLLLPISIDINNILIDYYQISKDKIKLSYLGVSNKVATCKIKSSRKLKIVSCSNVYPLKRIDLIYEILKNINCNLKISWTHIGAGEQLKELKEQVNADSRKNIKVNFEGQKTQSDLKLFYENNFFDLFVNVSEYEGLPVSIMEAFSYGIPAIATDVGGTSEIVNLKNGLLIEKYFNAKEVAKKIEFIYNGNMELLREGAFKTWFNQFNADHNYSKLINEFNKVNL